MDKELLKLIIKSLDAFLYFMRESLKTWRISNYRFLMLDVQTARKDLLTFLIYVAYMWAVFFFWSIGLWVVDVDHKILLAWVVA